MYYKSRINHLLVIYNRHECHVSSAVKFNRRIPLIIMSLLYEAVHSSLSATSRRDSRASPWQPDLTYIRPGGLTGGEYVDVCLIECSLFRSLSEMFGSCWMSSHTKSLSLNLELSHAYMGYDNGTYATLFYNDFFKPSPASSMIREIRPSGTGR
jgi:hypothetical protein